MLDPDYAHTRRVLFDCADQFLGLGFKLALLARVRVRDEVAHDRDTFDQFGHSLDKQKSECNHNQTFSRPLREPAGISRLLVDLHRSKEEGDAGEDHYNGQR